VPPSRSGLWLGLSAYVLWGLLTVYWKLLEDVDALELIGQRITWSVVLLVPVLAATGRLRALRRLGDAPQLAGRVVLAALLLAANWTTYVWAVTHDNVTEAALGYFMAPLGTMFLGVYVLGEHLRRLQWIAVAFAAAAVIELTFDYGHVPMFALVLAFSWSLYGLLKKVVPLEPLESLTAETVALLPAALLIVGVHQAAGDGVLQTGSATTIALVLLSGLITTVPLLLFAASARRVPLTTLGPLQYTVPTINFLLGVFVYHEALPAGRLLGFALVWVALAVFTIDAVHASRSTRRGEVPSLPARPDAWSPVERTNGSTLPSRSTAPRTPLLPPTRCSEG
jgi:chloramphenicol-sensitive protein RarD